MWFLESYWAYIQSPSRICLLFLEFKLQYYEKKHHFLPLFDPRYENKKKIKNLIVHPQGITNHILEYNMSTSSKDKPYMTEIVVVRPSFDTSVQNENPESLLQICKTCPIIS